MQKLLTDSENGGDRYGKIAITNKIRTRVQLVDANLPVLAIFAKNKESVPEQDWRILKLNEDNVLLSSKTQEFIGASTCYLEYCTKGEVITKLHLNPPEEMNENEWIQILENLYRKNVKINT